MEQVVIMMMMAVVVDDDADVDGMEQLAQTSGNLAYDEVGACKCIFMLVFSSS